MMRSHLCQAVAFAAASPPSGDGGYLAFSPPSGDDGYLAFSGALAHSTQIVDESWIIPTNYPAESSS